MEVENRASFVIQQSEYRKLFLRRTLRDKKTLAYLCGMIIALVLFAFTANCVSMFLVSAAFCVAMYLFAFIVAQFQKNVGMVQPWYNILEVVRNWRFPYRS